MNTSTGKRNVTIKWAQISQHLLLLLLMLNLGACNHDFIEGTYYTDNGEGTKVAMTLFDGDVQLWQGNTNQPLIIGHYTLENDQIILSFDTKTITVLFSGKCLYPIEDPSQRICKKMLL